MAKIRLVEEHDPLSGTTGWLIEVQRGWGPFRFWHYKSGTYGQDKKYVMEKWERAKKAKSIYPTSKVLEEAAL